ncbi:MAG: type I glyceraldehyde-3-phosphate dehydrogenase, partial [Bacilli bacterium]
MIKVAINGFGRIVRLMFRLMASDVEFEIVAINDLATAKELAHLLKYDSNYRNYFVDEITNDDTNIYFKGKKIAVFNSKDPSTLPWKALEVDEVMECSGAFTDKDKAYAHIIAGAKKVIISAPAKGDLKTIVYNVNEKTLIGDEEIISAASCTTNCLAPVLNVLDNNFGVIKGFMTTIHAYTNDQAVQDVTHKKGIEERRGRSAAMNIIPTGTGAAKAIGKVLPKLEGRLEGTALRVPVPTGSVIDLVLELEKKVTEEQVNETFKKNTNETLKFTMDPIVSSDVISLTCGAMVDGLLTKIIEIDDKQLLKVVAWYDNEWG